LNQIGYIAQAAIQGSEKHQPDQNADRDRDARLICDETHDAPRPAQLVLEIAPVHDSHPAQKPPRGKSILGIGPAVHEMQGMSAPADRNQMQGTAAVRVSGENRHPSGCAAQQEIDQRQKAVAIDFAAFHPGSNPAMPRAQKVRKDH
jgi:hypothetical protein